MRPPSGSLVRVVAAVLLLLMGTGATAQIPLQMNYQVMLTDDLDEPLADQSVQLVFRIYDTEVGGADLWDETHNTTTNSIGVVSVVLGSVTPLVIPFTDALWLQVEVEGEIMAPRRPLVSAPYARQADEAYYAGNSEQLGGTPAEDYALSDDLSQTGTINNPSNPLEWTRLKSVPSGFADGVDNAGSGDGHSLDAADGYPVDVVYVNADGEVELGEPPIWDAKLSVNADYRDCAGWFQNTSDVGYAPALFAKCDSSHAIHGESNIGTHITLSGMNGVLGVGGSGGANGGMFVSYGEGHGAVCRASGSGTGYGVLAMGADNYSGYFTGGLGLYSIVDDVYPAGMFESERFEGFADAGWFFSPSGVSSSTYTMYCRGYEGNIGRFRKDVDDDEYALYVDGYSATSEGLYVIGTIVSTGSMARAVETSRGREPVFAVAASDEELMATGKGRLSDGKATVRFDGVFAESISGVDGLRVTVTPIGGWSALYVESIHARGFEVRSDAGDKDIEFHWLAVGRSTDHERRPEVTIPDPVLEREIADRKEAEVRSRHPVRPEPPIETLHTAD